MKLSLTPGQPEVGGRGRVGNLPVTNSDLGEALGVSQILLTDYTRLPPPGTCHNPGNSDPGPSLVMAGTRALQRRLTLLGVTCLLLWKPKAGGCCSSGHPAGFCQPRLASLLEYSGILMGL